MNLKFGLPTIAALAVLLCVPAQAVLIDDFSSGDFLIDLQAQAAPPDQTGTHDALGVAGILGGDRRTTFTRTAGTAASAAALGANTVIAGMLTLDLGPGSEGNAELLYDGISAFDLIANGGGFFLDFTQINGVTSVNIIVATGGSTSTASLAAAGVGVNYIGASDFVGGATLTSLDSITLEIIGGNAADVQLDSFSTAPEPGAILLLGTGPIGLGWFRRRRK